MAEPSTPSSLPRPMPRDIHRRALEWWNAEESWRWWTSPQPLMDGRRTCDCTDEEINRLLDVLDSGAYL